MPVFERDGVSIHYEVSGGGFPVVLFAPGGMNSIAQLWKERPEAPGQPMPWIDPRTVLADDFQVIAMDQRNAGASWGPVSAADGWHTFTEDHLALLDHLGADRVHLMGGCIGSSYCLSFTRAAPARVASAVLQNPIGLSADNRPAFMAMVDGWAASLRARREDVTEEAVSGFRENMFGGEFVFSVDREFVRSCPIPMLVLAGSDEFHPRAVAEEIASLAPTATLELEWAGPDRHASTAQIVRDFLLANTPV